jgi:hypothetical protein
MSTRNLTKIILNNQVKVAQYGQYDGNLTGTGSIIANFISENLNKDWKLERFKELVNNLIPITDSEKLNKLIKEKWLNQRLPDAFASGTGAEILNLINDHLTDYVFLSPNFEKENFCEFCYTINLDNETVKVNNSTEISFELWTNSLLEVVESVDLEILKSI